MVHENQILNAMTDAQSRMTVRMAIGRMPRARILWL